MSPIRAGHAVNRDEGSAAPPPAPALRRTVENVRRFGGDVPRYLRFLAAGTAYDGADPVTVAAVAAWRSGVVGIRTDALRRAAVAAGPTAAAVAAALGLAPADVPALLRAQAADPFGWPSEADRRIGAATLAVLGGFRGLGGPFLAPPVEARPAGPGRFVVRTADGEWWSVDADVCGARWASTDGAPAPETDGAAATRVALDPYPGSYFLRLAAVG